ncbi:hypothetical protein GIB67_032830 [Kingdonia uniflora]|uniref:Uncharacterized protein n=1 Tax=Kingdonia uniflora TaxID=39325 RepID=A0A7J7NCA0_9MAGN|nr:hypothetical protein GIB67_032830 [Kingdonia uniflora]
MLLSPPHLLLQLLLSTSLNTCAPSHQLNLRNESDKDVRSKVEKLACFPSKNRTYFGLIAMADTQSVSTLIDSATSKIQQLQQAFAELENHRAATLNLKWKELEEHFHGLERSLKRRFYELEDQEKEYKNKALEAQEMLEKRKAAVVAKEHALLERLQDNRDAAVFSIGDALKKYKASSVGEPDVVNLDGHGGADMVVDEKPPDVKQGSKTQTCSYFSQKTNIFFIILLLDVIFFKVSDNISYKVNI